MAGLWRVADHLPRPLNSKLNTISERRVGTEPCVISDRRSIFNEQRSSGMWDAKCCWAGGGWLRNAGDRISPARDNLSDRTRR